MIKVIKQVSCESPTISQPLNSFRFFPTFLPSFLFLPPKKGYIIPLEPSAQLLPHPTAPSPPTASTPSHHPTIPTIPTIPTSRPSTQDLLPVSPPPSPFPKTQHRTTRQPKRTAAASSIPYVARPKKGACECECECECEWRDPYHPQPNASRWPR